MTKQLKSSIQWQKKPEGFLGGGVIDGLASAPTTHSALKAAAAERHVSD